MGLVKFVVDQLFIGDSDIFKVGVVFENYKSTKRGQWLENHGQLTYNLITDQLTFGYTLVVFAELSEQNWTFYQLKWK